jgi:transcriptional regulator with XRE-family HTH domain
MKATAQGQRLKLLRETLKATQDLIAELAGVSRVTIGRAETTNIKWRSADLRDGLMRAYGFTWDQLQDFMSGRLPFEQAVKIARPHIELAKKRGAVDKSRERRLTELIQMANMQQEILQATKDAAAIILAEVGENVSSDDFAQKLLSIDRAIRAHVADTIRALRSDRRAPL